MCGDAIPVNRRDIGVGDCGPVELYAPDFSPVI